MSVWEEAAWPALQATLFTWGVTAAGSALVFVLPMEQTPAQKRILDGMLGFAAGVMTAAAFWSLLAPAIAFAGESTSVWRWAPAVPVALGFGLGGGFLWYTDVWLERNGLDGAAASLDIMVRGFLPTGGATAAPTAMAAGGGSALSTPPESPVGKASKRDSLTRRAGGGRGFNSPGGVVARSHSDVEGGRLSPGVHERSPTDDKLDKRHGGVFGNERNPRSRRIWLLVIAITLHNFPEGLAVGVGFGSARRREAAAAAKDTEPPLAKVPPSDDDSRPPAAAAAATPAKNEQEQKKEGADKKKYVNSARSLAVGIALQNFPEGLAVSMPLRREGMPTGRAFLFGQASGLVEPIGGLVGAYAVAVAEPLLPLTMAFAAGAMLFVVVDQLVPEAHGGSPRLATAGFMGGFGLMMAMDVAFGS